MTLAQPAYLALLLVVLLMALIAVRIVVWRRHARAEFAGPQARRWRSAGFWLPALVVLAAAAVMTLAAARPRWGSTDVVVERSGVDLVIVLDVSKSMTATDADPSRMELAQSQLVRLIEAERGNRFGLVLFAGTAILRSPLTRDTQAMTQLIERADSEVGLVRVGSDLGAALARAEVILESSESAGKAILIVSDGEDHVGSFAERAARLREQGVLILTAGVGTPEGSTLSETNAVGETAVKLDANGLPVITRLDETNLQTLAEAGGGRYLRLGGDRTLLSFREDLGRLDQTPIGEETRQIPIERFQLFAGAAFALLLLAWFLPLRLRLPRLQLRRGAIRPEIAVMLLALVIGGCTDEDPLRARNQEANAAFEAGDYEGALRQYQDLIAQRPDVPELSYNASNAQHRLGNYQRAVEEAQRALPPRDPEVGALTYYALGNHLLALDELELAFDAYRSALLLDPTDEDAKYNLELTLALQAQRQQEQEQQQQQQQQEDQQGQSGEDEPAPGEEGEPGDQQQPGDQPSDGQPQPGEPGDQQQPSDPQDSPDGQPGDPTADDQQSPGGSADPTRDLQEALRGIDEEITFEDALRILDLLRLQQQQQQVPGSGGAPGGIDY